jgi:hypothetical protein
LTGTSAPSNEAVWHIFGFSIHEQDPAVFNLAVHFENGQRVYFKSETAIDRAINPPKTTLTEFFELCNRADAFARTLGTQFRSTTLFHMDSNKKNRCPASKARRLMHIPVYSNQTPWGEYILYTNDLTIVYSDVMYNEALIAIEDLCIIIANLALRHFGMYSPNRNAFDLINTELNRELQYNIVEMAAIVTRNVPLINEKQRKIYDRIMLAVSAGQGRFFFF